MDLPRLFASILDSFRRRNIPALRAIGSEITEEAFVTGNTQLVELSAACYSLSKFLEKHYITESRRWRGFEKSVESNLEYALKAAKKGDSPGTEEAVSELVEEIGELSESMGRFQIDVLTKARMKIAADAYAHGASLGRAADLANVDKRLVLNYIGVTNLSDKYETLPLAQRLTNARRLLG